MTKKKKVIVSVCIIGVLLIIIKGIISLRDVSAIGIIGAADGPTSIIVAESHFNNTLLLLLMVIILIGIIVIIKIKKK